MSPLLEGRESDARFNQSLVGTGIAIRLSTHYIDAQWSRGTTR